MVSGANEVFSTIIQLAIQEDWISLFCTSTQQYGIVSSTTLTSLLEHPTVFPISVNRLVFNSAILLRFDAAATYFGIAFVKLCIRQCMPIPRDLLMEYLEGDACSRDYQTRSKNKQIKH